MINIFKKPVQESTDEEELAVNDFARRTLFWSYRPRSYKIFGPFEEIKQELDIYLEKLFEGDIDEANGSVLDTIILDRCRQAKKDLAKQRVMHRDWIKNYDTRVKADEISYGRELERMRGALDEVEKELSHYEELADKDTFIEGGTEYES